MFSPLATLGRFWRHRALLPWLSRGGCPLSSTAVLPRRVNSGNTGQSRERNYKRTFRVPGHPLKAARWSGWRAALLKAYISPLYGFSTYSPHFTWTCWGGGLRLKHSFISPAQLHFYPFHPQSPGLGTPLGPLSPSLPPQPSTGNSTVPWQCRKRTFDKHHISGTAICEHVRLPHSKEERKGKEKKKKRRRVPFFPKTMETSS